MKNVLLAVMLIVGLSGYGAEKKPVVHHHKKTYHTKKYLHKHQLGLKRDKAKLDALKKRSHKKKFTHNEEGAPLAIPAVIDLSPKVSPPENQGSCGSCWAFSITKALRSAAMLVNKDPGTLAFEYLVSNCGGVVNESGCGGGDFPAGENMLNGKGPWLESQDPYTGRSERCKSGLSVAQTALTWNVVGDGNSPPTFQELAGALAQGHMLSIDVAVCGDWESYSGGVFNSNQCGPNRINHMINLVGTTCASPDASGNCVFDSNGQPVGGGYLKVMNNWGNSWGEAGYMRTNWGVDAVANTAMYFDVEAPVPPTPPVPPIPPAPPEPSGIPVWIFILIGVLTIAVIALAVVVVNGKKKVSGPN